MFIKKEYSTPEFEVEMFSLSADVITTSGEDIPGEDFEF